jgi:hypothetical protein
MYRLQSKFAASMAFLMSAILFSCSSSEVKPMAEDRSVASTKYNDAQEEQGAVQRFLISARGDVTGLILDGRIQVSISPVMATRIKKIVSINDVILVKGFYENDRVFKAEDITNVRTTRRVTEQLSTPPGPAQDDLPNHLAPQGTHSRISKTPAEKFRGLNKISAEGTVQTRLYGKFGELNGVILSDGTIVNFRPDVINTMELNAEIGDKLKASGYGTQNNYGRAIDATEVIRE